jgi:NitT/TauT family transport system ATP-binding protein
LTVRLDLDDDRAASGATLVGAARSRVRIDVRNLTKTFLVQGRGIQAVDDVSFGIAQGEFVSLLGPSGCGKSTVLNMIATLLAPTGGDVLIDGERVVAHRPNRKVGYVFQKDTLFPWRTVEDNVGYGLELAGVAAGERRHRVAAAIEQAGLTGFGAFYPAALSGGMRQRVALMRALIMQPQILLMDEPFGALDTHTKLDMHGVLLGLWERQKQTVVFVTHDLGEALTLSDRIILFTARPGRVKQSFAIDFARPRDAVALRETKAFADMFSVIWHSLGEEFLRSRTR